MFFGVLTFYFLGNYHRFSTHELTAGILAQINGLEQRKGNESHNGFIWP